MTSERSGHVTSVGSRTGMNYAGDLAGSGGHARRLAIGQMFRVKVSHSCVLPTRENISRDNS